MTATTLIALVLAIAVALYVLWALFRPEDFE